MPRFAGEYEARVLRFLDTAAVSPAIAFIGLITVVPGAPLRRPAIVYPTAARLVERAGADNVRLRAVSAHRDEAGVMVFSGWNVDVEVGEGPTVANAG